MAREHDLCAACGHHRERHHPSCHVFPCTCQRFSDVAPAPSVTAGLLAAAQAYIDEREKAGDTDYPSWVAIDAAYAALRAELAAATAGPVALTDEQPQPSETTVLAVAVFRERHGRDPELETCHVQVSDRADFNGIVREIDVTLAKLNDLGYAIVRRPS